MTLRLILLSILLGFTQAIADVKQPSMFSEGMVLEREIKVPVWEWGKAGGKASVDFADQRTETTVTDDGSWKVSIEPLKASTENRVMTITVGGESIEVKDVGVGEVWVCSGQSNMQWTLNQLSEGKGPVATFIKNELKNSFDPMIRQIGSPNRVALWGQI